MASAPPSTVARMSSSSARPGLDAHRPAVRGGDAWVVPPRELDVDAVWVTSAAPEIRVLDLRAQREAAPVADRATPGQ